MKKVSLQDIANRLNVSKALVSFVLNGQGDERGINKETQDRVLSLVRELNYKPNYYARGLRLGKSNTIGLVVADISNNFYSKIAKRIEEVAAGNGYNLIFCSSDENPEKEIALIEMLRERQVDGVIVSTTQRESSYFTRLKHDHFPFVLIDRQIRRLKTNYVGVDNYNGSYQATTDLIEKGYSRIGLLKISPTFLSSIREREAGYLDALRDHGIRVRTKLIREIEFNQISSAVNRELSDLVKPPFSIDALFALNNNITVACLKFFQNGGLSLSKKPAIVSFDDIELFRLSDPTISAIAQPLKDIGENAVNLLLEIVEGGHAQEATQIILPVEHIERQSSKDLTQEVSIVTDPVNSDPF